jgi:selenoprotein W-related protein
MVRRHDIVDLPFSLARDIFQPVMVHSPRIEIKYCTQCRWLLRAAWMAQELLTTFQDEVGEVTLVPGTGGVFEVRIGDEVIWSRAEQGRFPDIKELKQLVRDRIAPAKDLGHSKRQPQ